MDLLAVISAYLNALFATVGATLGLSPNALAHVDGYIFAVPAGIGLIGGISTMIGQSVILTLNRVRFLRAILTLIGAGIGVLATGVLQGLLLGFLHWIFFHQLPSVSVILPIVLASFAPYWFGFLILLPYSGPGFARILSVWQLMALWTMIGYSLHVNRSTALLLALGAWLGTIITNFVFENSPIHLRERTLELLAGKPLHSATDILYDAKLSSVKGERS